MPSPSYPLSSLGLALALSFLFSCQTEPATDLGKAALIPYPNQVVADSSNFILREGAVIRVPKGRQSAQLAKYLRASIKEITGLELEYVVGSVSHDKGDILLTVGEMANEEAYQLIIERENIKIEAA